MKRISFLLLALTFATTQSYGLTYSSGKLIYHKEWSSGNIKSVFTEKKNSLKTSSEIIKKLFSPPQTDQWILTMSKILGTNIQPVGKPTHIEAETGFHFYNFGSEPHTYTIRRGIIAFQKHQQAYFSITEEEFIVDPGQLFSDVISQTDIEFPTSGDWYVDSVISVQSNDDTKLFDSEDDSVITIPES